MQLKVSLCPSEPNQQAFTSTSTAGVTTTYGVSNYRLVRGPGQRGFSALGYARADCVAGQVLGQNFAVGADQPD